MVISTWLVALYILYALHYNMMYINYLMAKEKAEPNLIPLV